MESSDSEHAECMSAEEWKIFLKNNKLAIDRWKAEKKILELKEENYIWTI